MARVGERLSLDARRGVALGVHHILPALPRALHPAGAAKLARLFPDEYRAVDDFGTLAALWVARHQTFTEPFKMKDLGSGGRRPSSTRV